MESVALDPLDVALAHALQLDGRAPFSRIGEALGVSENTVARRYRRLRSAGALRVVGVVDGLRLGYASWAIRLRCAPDAGLALATALARRSDTSWVSLLSGGTEIVCGTLARTAAERDAFLLEKLPRTRQVTSVSAHRMLHMFTGGPTGWAGLRALSDEQIERLRPSPVPPQDGGAPIVVEDEDHALVEALARDARLSHAELAGVTGRSESTVRRRLARLRESGALYFDVDIAPGLLGYQAEAYLWMSVKPSRLAAAGEALAAHPEVTVAAATTGAANLYAGVACRDSRDLYRYLTERIGALKAVRHVETLPLIRTVKRAGAVLR
ncbi:AsnC family transcriptional regulator [Sphaerisporangium krabiense]|uniref:DNA-binding Lrp family transcriptional regulator n=1 Tax=Sphaerisporangium krabiense TaxID=763782 RepID=A0A7W8Z6K4_9ACTN|nr:Lrp/AsnC family transcriptional regulator [Sphaerisporangium krabiense]MBB5628295.1 DNA-binding Lrp family transcriptional regulator [Sphaerisporangium krabiense]GII66292.1 AsnC family transcriptional regulator [Sphaerisporangium krabiense]